MVTLVAGGAGFIGSHLVDALLEQQHKVVCIDNFFIGTKENIAHLKDHPNFVFYEEDLSNLSAIDAIFQKEKPEYVYHLAANSDIQASAKKPEIEYRNTYSTTFVLLECMRRHQVSKLFFASTSAVYGEQEGKSVAEMGIDLQPISYYGASKLGSEALINAYSYMNHFSSLVFRFPNVIGPRLTHGVIFDFIKKLNATPENLIILGDGNQSKPYMYVEDLVRGIIQFSPIEEGVTVYNIGVDSQTTVTQIANIVCEKMGLKGTKYSYTGGVGGWRGDVPVFSYNLDKIHQDGWSAQYSSDEAVQKTVEEVLK